jgi:hypothetical protein
VAVGVWDGVSVIVGVFVFVREGVVEGDGVIVGVLELVGDAVWVAVAVGNGVVVGCDRVGVTLPKSANPVWALHPLAAIPNKSNPAKSKIQYDLAVLSIF